MPVPRLITLAFAAAILARAGSAFAQDDAATPSVAEHAEPTATQEQEPAPPIGEAPSRWNPHVHIDVGAIFQFGTDLDGDADANGEYSVNRYGIAAGFAFTPAPKLTLDIAFGFSIDAYDFTGDAGFGAFAPWETVHTWWAAPQLQWNVNDRWTVWGGPRFVHAAETDVGNEEPGMKTGTVWTAGASVGFTYHANDRLHLGLGLSVQTQLEDSVAIFPLPVLHWHFADGWTLRTVGGPSTGASTGAGGGVEIAWNFHPHWEASLGARLETRRFRLDQDGIAPDGIGDESIMPVYARLRWQPCPAVSVGVMGGMILFGELRLEDDNGDRVFDEAGDPIRDVDVDPTPFVGVNASIRF